MVELLPTIPKVHDLLPRTTKAEKRNGEKIRERKEKNGKSASGGYGEGNREKILNMRHINAI